MSNPPIRNRLMTTMIRLLLVTMGAHQATAALTQALCSHSNTGLDYADGRDLASIMQGSLTVAECGTHSNRSLPIQRPLLRYLQG